jgi:hypothetical protein
MHSPQPAAYAQREIRLRDGVTCMNFGDLADWGCRSRGGSLRGLILFLGFTRRLVLRRASGGGHILRWIAL